MISQNVCASCTDVSTLPEEIDVNSSLHDVAQFVTVSHASHLNLSEISQVWSGPSIVGTAVRESLRVNVLLTKVSRIVTPSKVGPWQFKMRKTFSCEPRKSCTALRVAKFVACGNFDGGGL